VLLAPSGVNAIDPDAALVPAGSFSRTAGVRVRRDKAAIFQRVQTPPGDRSSRKQPGQAWRRRNV
jgi:hypothetical protein